MAGRMVSLIIHAFWFSGTFFFFFWTYSAKPLSRLYSCCPRGVSLFPQKPSVTGLFQRPSASALNKGSVVELCGRSYLGSGAIPLPNSTVMGHLRPLESDEVSGARPAGAPHRRSAHTVGLMTLGAVSSVSFHRFAYCGHRGT